LTDTSIMTNLCACVTFSVRPHDFCTCVEQTSYAAEHTTNWQVRMWGWFMYGGPGGFTRPRTGGAPAPAAIPYCGHDRLIGIATATSRQSSVHQESTHDTNWQLDVAQNGWHTPQHGDGCEEPHPTSCPNGDTKSMLFKYGRRALGNVGLRMRVETKTGFATLRHLGTGRGRPGISRGQRWPMTVRRNVFAGLDSEYPGPSWGSKEGKCLH